jgi:hypothetical protein
VEGRDFVRTAVAISTTGDEHRIGFLETAIRMWDSALSPGDSLYVTVDGTAEQAEFVAECVAPWTGSVYRVGELHIGNGPMKQLGVAANKNTGLELMMDGTRADHLFLCDDDTYPLASHALRKHTELAERIPHSMIVWGGHRLANVRGHYATWTWPRGVLLYSTRRVVEKVGGMVEAFGLGGHEHAEWSRRIFQHGLTPAPYVTPALYAERGTRGKASRASVWWHCEDMRAEGETSVELGHRRKAITSVRTQDRDWSRINAVMDGMDGNLDFVPFRAHDNGRASATLCSTSTSRGAGGDL